MRDGFIAAEGHFMSLNYKELRDKSGSCAIVCILTDTQAYVANLGDSRAICSSDRVVEALSRDHKPSDIREQKRILDAGGQLF